MQKNQDTDLQVACRIEPASGDASFRRYFRVTVPGGGQFIAITPDGSDVEALAGGVERGVQTVTDDERDQWRDMGYWLLPLLALLLLPFFRDGGAVVFE